VHLGAQARSVDSKNGSSSIISTTGDVIGRVTGTANRIFACLIVTSQLRNCSLIALIVTAARDIGDLIISYRVLLYDGDRRRARRTRAGSVAATERENSYVIVGRGAARNMHSDGQRAEWATAKDQNAAGIGIPATSYTERPQVRAGHARIWRHADALEIREAPRTI